MQLFASLFEQGLVVGHMGIKDEWTLHSSAESFLFIGHQKKRLKRFIEGEERSQVTLLPECLDDYIAEGNRRVRQLE